MLDYCRKQKMLLHPSRQRLAEVWMASNPDLIKFLAFWWICLHAESSVRHFSFSERIFSDVKELLLESAVVRRSKRNRRIRSIAEFAKSDANHFSSADDMPLSLLNISITWKEQRYLHFQSPVGPTGTSQLPVGSPRSQGGAGSDHWTSSQSPKTNVSWNKESSSERRGSGGSPARSQVSPASFLKTS